MDFWKLTHIDIEKKYLEVAPGLCHPPPPTPYPPPPHRLLALLEIFNSVTISVYAHIYIQYTHVREQESNVETFLSRSFTHVSKKKRINGVLLAQLD